MTTDELIVSIASGAGPARRQIITHDLALVMVSGMIVCSAISLGARDLVPEAMWTGAALWVKLAYALALAASGAWLLRGLACPGKPVAAPLHMIALIGLSMAIMGTYAVLSVPPGERAAYLLGNYALICPWAIPLLSLPALGFLFYLTKYLAPTDLRGAGFANGLLAGSIAAAAYALSCKEEAVGFVAVWYSLGILFSAGLGAWAGPHLLRW